MPLSDRESASSLAESRAGVRNAPPPLAGMVREYPIGAPVNDFIMISLATCKRNGLYEAKNTSRYYFVALILH